MLHLTDGRHVNDPALCGNYSDPDNPDCIPLRWWNGNREGVCLECLRLAQPIPMAEEVERLED